MIGYFSFSLRLDNTVYFMIFWLMKVPILSGISDFWFELYNGLTVSSWFLISVDYSSSIWVSGVASGLFSLKRWLLVYTRPMNNYCLLFSGAKNCRGSWNLLGLLFLFRGSAVGVSSTIFSIVKLVSSYFSWIPRFVELCKFVWYSILWGISVFCSYWTFCALGFSSMFTSWSLFFCLFYFSDCTKLELD